MDAVSHVFPPFLSCFFLRSLSVVCCTVKDDLLVTLEQLARRPDGQRFDYIIVETSGLADPAPLMEALWADSELDPAVRVDGVVCVCDACHISEHLQRTAEARAQLAVSDVALINRCDLTDEMTVSKAEDEIRNVNAECKVLKSSWGKVDLDEILGMRTLDTEREPQIRSWNDVRSECDGCSLGGHDGHDGHDHGKKKKRHDGDISTWQIEMEGKMDEEKLRSFLAEVLWEPQGWDVLRAKGAVSLQSSQYMCALQAVRAVWTIQPTPLLSQGKSRFVFIGRNLKPDVWLPKLKDCLFKSE